MNYQQQIFGKLLEKRRKEKGLTKKELAIKLGYSNITKGIRRVDSIEDGDLIEPVVSKVIKLLKITQEEKAECEKQMAKKVREYIDSLSPLKPCIVFRAIPGVYIRKDVPQHLSEKEMVEYAETLSKEMNKHLCLNYAHEKRYWINQKGVYSIGTEFGGGPRMMLKK